VCLGDARRAIGYFEQRLAIAREIGDRRGEGNAIHNWALALERLGEPVPALEKADTARAIYEQIEDPNAEKARELVERLRGGF
jgi:tetratricopeptide (TPR) repeat protein